MDEHQETVARLQGAPADPLAKPVPWYRKEHQLSARVATAILVPVGALGLWWNWHEAHTQGRYYPKVAFIAPFCIVLGLYYLIYSKEDPTVLPKPLQLRHWILYALGVALGALNWYAFEYGLY